ncbi:MAG TPA: hypothetical protein VFH70_12910 [Acidimicrobiales bacterium]|nr:hypothetical protein [Acidimicrobiales bacterium]
MTADFTRDTVHRTAKLLLESGKARTLAEARAYLESMVLQVAVGPDIGRDLAAQAALLTAVNAGARAFLGGVHVVLDGDPLLDVPWAGDLTAGAAVQRFGGMAVEGLNPALPTLAIGAPVETVGSYVLSVTHHGWVGGVVQSPDSRWGGGGTAPAGIVAAALGISEIFQRELGDPVPGRRDVGISLWRPDLDWRSAEATGPDLRYLPAALWLLGLGHLGQAYAWVVGMLPYASPAEVRVGLVDYDRVVAGNTATQLLVTDANVNRRKTRVVAGALEGLGFDTAIVDRAFDDTFRPEPHADPNRCEPTVALAGFDSRDPRLLLGDDRFTWVVDGGLGRGSVDYLDIVINTFPAPEDPTVAFPEPRPRSQALPEAYESEVADRVAKGMDETAVRCGLLDIAGVTIGAAFVGSVAACLVVGDLLRNLHGGSPFSVVHIDLRHPENLVAVPNRTPAEATLAFTLARTR